ncbi:cyclic nucleotide-binding domain-containing protein [Rhizoctonia solani AG-1 IA]|uniref:AA9 family lytic polysaccharide monooxygenase n=1 Tax=Thanatephorus cucumeris (strain AG1-IA) TaxID=983506 RepID=L8WG16_THACA|nr:cyclic nucleotide-binding domain-containing protein [Rhizoctonia solani AG-1 IA]
MNNLAAYFTRVELQAGDVLWRQGDQPDGLYVIESGVLQANYDFAAHSAPVQESMTAGTLAGELSALSGSPRNATVVAERASVVWKLSTNDFERLEREQSDVAKCMGLTESRTRANSSGYIAGHPALIVVEPFFTRHSGVNNPSRHPHFGGHFGNELRVVAHEISNGNAPVVIVLATILAEPWNGLVTKHHSQDANPRQLDAEEQQAHFLSSSVWSKLSLEINMKFATIAAVLASAGAAMAHAKVRAVFINGVDQGNGEGSYIRAPPNNNPVKDLSSNDIICNVNNSPVPKTLEVKGGDQITFEC